MKEKETKKKREIRLPKVLVYFVASIVTAVLTVGVSLFFGVANAIDCITVVAEVFVLSSVLVDIVSKYNDRKYALTLKYWVMVALVLLCDLLFFFTSQSKTYEMLGIRGALFGLILVVAVFYCHYTYKPSVMTQASTLEDNLAKAFTAFITANPALNAEEMGKGLVALLKEGK